MRLLLVLVCILFSQFSLAEFKRGDAVVVDVDIAEGPYNLAGCYVDEGRQVCMPSELGFFVHSDYLFHYEDSQDTCLFTTDDQVAVENLKGMRGVYIVSGLYVHHQHGCVYKLHQGSFVNEAYLRRFE